MSWSVTGERPQYAKAPASVRPQDQFIPGYSMPPFVPTPKEPPPQQPPKEEKQPPGPVTDPRVDELEREIAKLKGEQAARAAERRRNEIEAAKGLARQFGLDESIFDRIVSLVQDGFEGDALRLQLRATEEYKKRFYGNELIKQRFPQLPQLEPQEYIALEKDYSNLMATFGASDLATRDNFAELIGNQVSAGELQSRFQNAVVKVRNADPALKSQLARTFPGLTDTDLAKSLLLGKDGSDYLARRVRTAEIGAEAETFGLGFERAAQLEQLGVTRQTAREGFGTISRQLPTLEKLGSIFGEETTGIQQELEQEQFQNVESRRRRRLVESEEALFSADTGLGSAALRSQTRGQI